MKGFYNARDRAELLSRLHTLRPDSRRQWGRMSAHQMVCHLGDAFRMSLGERSADPVGSPLAHTLVKWIALRLPTPWPKGSPSAPQLDQAKQGTQPGNFEADVQALMTLMERFAQAESRGREHPYFGRMSRWEWGRWTYLHMHHHLRQFGA